MGGLARAPAPRALRLGDLAWSLLFLACAAFIAAPATNALFVAWTAGAPYPTGFAKFALLATMGELLALRILRGRYARPKGLLAKAAVWGLIGMLVVLMFQLFSAGVAGAQARGLLPAARGFPGDLLRAFLASASMNLTFGPAFMACHRISDRYIDRRASGERPRLREVVRSIDWAGFLELVVGKTIPIFWIPAHTIAFLLPGEYRVLAAAFLSIALGAILAFAKAGAGEEAA